LTITKAVQADRLFGKKDVQTGETAFEPAHARFDLADVFAAYALGVEHLVHRLHQQIQAGIGHLRPPLLLCASRPYARGEPGTTLDPPGKQASL
jgi:hypothetical protein